MPLQRKLEDIARTFRKEVAPTLPPETIETMSEFQQRLAARELEKAMLKTGEPFPDFTLPDGEGEDVALHGLLARGSAVVFFFRGKW